MDLGYITAPPFTCWVIKQHPPPIAYLEDLAQARCVMSAE